MLNACDRLNEQSNAESGRKDQLEILVIWSSDEAHTVDALAVGGDEGRCSLRKAAGR